eukprot:1158200_1
MKTILAALLAATQANVHEYWAEHNYICNLCENSVEFVVAGGDMEDFLACKDGTGNEFSTVCTKVRNAQNEILSMQAESGMNKYQICEKLNFCGDWIDEGFENQHVWDPQLINSINDDTASTWQAALPKQFEGMTLGDIRRTRLGTVVDKDHKYKYLQNQNQLNNKLKHYQPILIQEHNGLDVLLLLDIFVIKVHVVLVGLSVQLKHLMIDFVLVM